MGTTGRSTFKVTLAALAVALLLTGCGDDDAEPNAAGTPEITTETTAPDPAPTPDGDGEPGGTTTPHGSEPEDPGTGADPEIPAGCYLVMHTITDDRPLIREIALRSTGEVVARSTNGEPWEPQGWQEACEP